MSHTEDYSEHLRISDMHQEERPRERLLAHGPKVLSTADLLAILLRTGTTQENVLSLANRLLSKYNGHLWDLYRSGSAQMGQGIRGFGAAKAATVMAALELGVRLVQDQQDQQAGALKVTDSQAVYNYMYARLFGSVQEEVWLLTFDASLSLTSTVQISRGGVSESLADLKVILRHALLSASSGIILVHNHPSGQPLPSVEDDRLTQSLQRACEIVGVSLLDHLIFANNCYYSYSDERRV